jgi:hypothetical protein
MMKANIGPLIMPRWYTIMTADPWSNSKSRVLEAKRLSTLEQQT